MDLLVQLILGNLSVIKSLQRSMWIDWLFVSVQKAFSILRVDSSISPKVYIIVAAMSVSPFASARTYQLPTNQSNIIGESESLSIEKTTTLSKIAIDQRIGFDTLFLANKQFLSDSVVPGDKVKLPLEYILPNVSHEGIVINLPEQRLYYFHPDNKRVSIYPIGIGKSGWETPEMTSAISEIRKRPTWTPPASIRRAYIAADIHLPASIPPGPNNPLGSYAMRLGSTNILVHGTSNPAGVGRRVSSGCIRLYEEDITELASLVELGTPVQIVNQPIKWTRNDKGDFIEAHQPLARLDSKDITDSNHDAQKPDQHKHTLHHGFRVAESRGGLPARLQAERFAHDMLIKRALFTGLPQLVDTNIDTSISKP